MPEEKSRTNRPDKSFADYVKEAPSVTEAARQTVMLVGTVMRSEKEGMFVLATPDGQTLELNVDVVNDYKPVPESGQRMVQLEIYANRLPDDVLTRTLPAIDRLTTLKEAPFDTIKETGTDHITDQTIKEGPWDTLKEGSWDTLKEMGKDPIYDTLKEVVGDPNTLVEQIGTAVENIGAGIPGGELVNPAMAGGAVPFVMATPHHAATAPMMMQAMAGGQGLMKQPAIDGGGQAWGPITIKESYKDPIADTLKESYKDPIRDTLKELISDPNTWVEGIGTIAEGVGQLPGGGVLNPPIWNLPGLMF